MHWSWFSFVIGVLAALSYPVIKAGVDKLVEWIRKA